MTTIQSVDALLETFIIADEDEKSNDKQYGDIDTNIMYSNNTGSRYIIEMPTTDNPSGSYKMSTAMITHRVINGRDAGCMFGSHGFQLLNQNTKLSTKDFYENSDGIIEKVYYPEIEATVKALTGAQYVTTIHHQVRAAGPTPKDVKVDVSAPAHAAHCDYTPYSGIKSFKYGFDKIPKELKEKIDFTKGRFAMINVWRNISDINTIQNNHLAVCDGRTIIAPDDYLKYDYIANGYKSESFYLNADHEDLHKWYYFPGMKKNELLVFMQYDSDYTANARYGFHTAIHDPTADAKCPNRESIEARLIVYFPKHTPNTIPTFVEGNGEGFQLKTAVNGITEAIKVPNLWPDTAKQQMAEKVANSDIKEVIEWVVEGSKKGGFHSLGDATDEQCKSVVDEIMKNVDEFKKTAEKNFPFNA